jgi:hypothetical protein
VLDALPAPQPIEYLGLFLQTIGQNDQRNRLSHGFLRRVAVHPLRTFVPAGDHAVKILADDGIVGRLHDRAQSGPRVVSAAVGLPQRHNRPGKKHEPQHPVDLRRMGNRPGMPRRQKANHTPNNPRIVVMIDGHNPQYHAANTTANHTV